MVVVQCYGNLKSKLQIVVDFLEWIKQCQVECVVIMDVVVELVSVVVLDDVLDVKLCVVGIKVLGNSVDGVLVCLKEKGKV